MPPLKYAFVLQVLKNCSTGGVAGWRLVSTVVAYGVLGTEKVTDPVLYLTNVLEIKYVRKDRLC